MPTEKNKGRAEQIVRSAPEGQITYAEGIKWLFEAVVFLLMRYIDGK